MSSEIIKELTLQVSTITEGVAALIIAIAVLEGVFRTFLLILQSFSPSDVSSHEAKEDVRLRLGRWLSLALEFLGFTGPEVREGIAALKQKRAPNFPLPPTL